MMGKDVERILSRVNAIKDAANESINSLANQTAYRLRTPDTVNEEPVPAPAHQFIDPISKIMNSLIDDYIKMNILGDTLYAGIYAFNNTYGSPWTEFKKMKISINTAEEFGAHHPMLYYVGEKSGMLSLLNVILQLSIDFKQSLIQYHDYIQRGYDNKFNSNNPSITHDRTIDRKSFGINEQEFWENVNIHKPSIDPY